MTRIEQWNEQDYHSNLVVSKTGTTTQRVAKTLVSSVRYRPTIVATIASHLISSDERPRTISDVIKLSMECFADMILASSPSRQFPDETSAIEFLQSLGLINRGPNSQNIRRIHNNLSMESLRETANEPDIVTQAEVNEALRIYNEQQKEELK